MQQLKDLLSRKGFDIHVCFSSSVYNDYLKSKGLMEYALPKESNCLLIGNTRKLWPVFINDSKGTKGLDAWTASVIESTTRKLFQQFSIYYVFDDFAIFNKSEISRGKKRIAFQTLGECVGLSISVKGTGLTVTPQHGPWFAYRAVIVFHDQTLKSHCLKQSQALDKWINQSFSTDQLKYLQEKTHIAQTFKEFIEIRKEIGILLNKQDQEYSYNQMMYHYTKSKDNLKI